MSDETQNVMPDLPDPLDLATNDAVAGEPVMPTGHYAGPEGSEPLEAEPEAAANDLEDEPID